MDIIEKLIIHNIVSYGNFILKSGLSSNMYIDLKKVISFPQLMNDISEQLYSLIKQNNQQSIPIVGIPFGGIPYSISISSKYNIPMMYVRDQKKEYGMCNIIEGILHKKCIIIEDVITTGSSILKYIKILEEHNIQIIGIYTILDRREIETDLLDNKYAIKSLMKLSEIKYHSLSQKIIYNIDHKNSRNEFYKSFIKNKNSRIVLSIDNTDPVKILEIINDYGQYIAGVKLHYDILNFENIDRLTFIDLLIKYKKIYNIFIIEDRKLADIGIIMITQAKQYESYADIITVHSISGFESICALSNLNMDILLINQLSSSNNLITKEYSDNTKYIGLYVPNVIGFITQDITLNGYLDFTPGISLTNTTDLNGQIYKPILNSNKSDFYIIGRSILESETKSETLAIFNDLINKL